MNDIYDTPQAPTHTAPNEQDLAAFAGTSDYLEQWAGLMSGESRFAGFNWAAFFFTGFWFAYRKMYLWAGGIVAAGIVLEFVLAFAVVMFDATNVNLVFLWLLLSIVLLRLPLGFAANVLYYRRAESVIDRTLATTDPARTEELKKRGGTNHVIVVVLAILLFGLNMVGAFLPTD